MRLSQASAFRIRPGWQDAATLLLALIVSMTAWARAWPMVGLHHDDGTYLVTAKSLAEGRGYRLLQLPGEPVQTKYPVLFPAVLATLWKIDPAFPQNVSLLRLVPVVSGALAACVLWLACLRAGRPGGMTWLAVAAACTAPQVAGLLTLLMSEGLFLLVSALATLALWEMSRDQPARWARPGVAAGLLAASALVRSIGLGLVAGGLAYLWRRRQLTPSALLAALLPLTVWMLWQGWFGLGGQDPYDTSYAMWLAGVPLSSMPVIARDNILSILVGGGFLLMQPWVTSVPEWLRGPCSLVIALALVLLCGMAARRDRGPLAWLLGGYFALTVLWPWPSVRFVAIVLPMVLVLATLAVRGRTVRLCSVLLGATLAANLAYATVNGPALWAGGIRYPDGPPIRWDEFDAAFSWIRRHTPRESVIASLSEPMVYLYTGRHGVFPYAQDSVRMFYSSEPSIGTASEMLERLHRNRVTYLLRMPVVTWPQYGLFERLVHEARLRPAAGLRQVYVGHDPRFEVLALSETVSGDTAPASPTPGNADDAARDERAPAR